MADKRQHNATLNSKGLEQAVSDDDARRMIETKGERSILIIEATHGPYMTQLDDTQRINLIAEHVALVPAKHADKVRRMLKAIALEHDPGDTLDLTGSDGDVPTVDEAAGALPDDWDGNPESNAKPTAKKTTAKKTAAKKTAAKKSTSKGPLSSVPDA